MTASRLPTFRILRSRPPSRAAINRAIASLAATVLMTGCVVGPDYHPPRLALPERWGSVTDTKLSATPELSRWWTRLNDPLLDELVNEAVQGSLDVATARAKVREARASYAQATGGLFPSLTASAGATRSAAGVNSARAATSGVPSSVSPATPIPLPSRSPVNTFQAGLDASWELDLFGTNRRATEAARYGIDAAQWNLRSTLLTLVGDIATDYTRARGDQARLELARNTVRSQQETARITRIRFEAGVSSQLDLANANGLAQTTQAMIPVLETDYALAVHALSVLTGRPPQALVGRMTPVAALPVPPLPIPVGVPADTLLNRPDVHLKESQYAQSTALVGKSEAARYPKLTLTGMVNTSGTQIGDLERRSSIGWSIGPSLTVPLFNGGQLAAAVEMARAQRDQAFIAYRASILTALQDVENASVNLTQETTRVEDLAASAASYQQAAELARTLYRFGATSFLDVLTAERSLYSAQDALIQSRMAVTTDYVALNKALGGGWSGEVDVSTPEVVDGYTGPHLRREP